MSSTTDYGPIQDDLDYVAKELLPIQKLFSSQANQYKRWFYRSQTLLITSSLLLITLGIIEVSLRGSTPLTSWSRLILGLLAGLFVVVSGRIRFQHRWLNARAASEALKREQYYFLARTGGYESDPDAQRLLRERITIIERQHDQHQSQPEGMSS